MSSIVRLIHFRYSTSYINQNSLRSSITILNLQPIWFTIIIEGGQFVIPCTGL